MIVRDAARATLAAGTARVRQIRFVEGRDEAISREEGETDFVRRRTRTTIEYAPPPPEWHEWAARWPWVFGEDDDGEPAGPTQMLYAGTASWCVMPGAPPSRIRGDRSDDPAARRRGHTDPTWIMEAIAHAGQEQRLGPGHLRFVTDLADTGVALDIPPHRGRRLPRIAGEAWLDAPGRIVRVTWRRADRRRGGRERDERVRWTTTQLWDFGISVDIELPAPERTPPLPVMVAQLAWRLWRRKRACEAAGDGVTGERQPAR